MKRLSLLAPLCAALWLCAGLLASCGSNKQKTQEQISEDYHKYLTTSDLALCELRGNVLSVEYPGGFLQQYIPDLPECSDTVFFMPDGLSGFDLWVGNDELLSVRGTGGELIGFWSRTKTRNRLRCHYKDDRHVDQWIWTGTRGDSLTVNFRHQGERVSAFTVTGEGTDIKGVVKIIDTDEIHNWTKRQISLTNGRRKYTLTQTRRIAYY